MNNTNNTNNFGANNQGNQNPTRKIGRKTILDQYMIDSFVKLLSSGVFVSTACDFMGVSTTRFYAWYNKGKAIAEAETEDTAALYYPEDEIYVQFYDACRSAISRAEVFATNAFARAAVKDWKAAKEWLIIRHPNRWGVRQKLDIQMDISNVIEALPDPLMREKVLDQLDAFLESGTLPGAVNDATE